MMAGPPSASGRSRRSFDDLLSLAWPLRKYTPSSSPFTHASSHAAEGQAGRPTATRRIL